MRASQVHRRACRFHFLGCVAAVSHSRRAGKLPVLLFADEPAYLTRMLAKKRLFVLQRLDAVWRRLIHEREMARADSDPNIHSLPARQRVGQPLALCGRRDFVLRTHPRQDREMYRIECAWRLKEPSSGRKQDEAAQPRIRCDVDTPTGGQPHLPSRQRDKQCCADGMPHARDGCARFGEHIERKGQPPCPQRQFRLRGRHCCESLEVWGNDRATRCGQRLQKGDVTLGVAPGAHREKDHGRACLGPPNRHVE